MARDVLNNLLGEEVPMSEALEEMSKPIAEDSIIIEGEKISKRVYDLCIKHYLAEQYGEIH